MKKNSYILFLLLFVSFISEISLIQAYILYDPMPEISTDKDVYYIPDVINLNVSYFIYYSSNSDLDIKIYYSFSDLELSNAVFLFDCPEIKSYFQTNYSFSVTDIINSSIIVPSIIWFSLTATEYGITTILDSKEVTITKYDPVFKTPFPETIQHEYESDYIINNSIFALQNEIFPFKNEHCVISVFNESNRIYNSIIETNIWGNFQIILQKENFKSLGIYQIQFLFNATDFFFNETIQQNLTIITKQLRLNFLNETHIFLRSINETFAIQFNIIDQENKSYVIIPSVFNITSTLNLVNITHNECYKVVFYYPQNSGIYIIKFLSCYPNYLFLTNELSLSFSLNSLIIEIQEYTKKDFDYLYIDLLISNFTNFDLINFSNLKIEIYHNPEWIELNYLHYKNRRCAASNLS